MEFICFVFFLSPKETFKIFPAVRVDHTNNIMFTSGIDGIPRVTENTGTHGSNRWCSDGFFSKLFKT